MSRFRILTAVSFATALTAVVSAALAAPRTAQVQRVSIAIKSGEEHGRKGPDGQWHDAYLPARFTVHTGAKVVVTIRNYDDSVHTFTSPKLGLHVAIPGGSPSHPGVHTFSFVVKRPGRYIFHCNIKCDKWAMSRLGFMRGLVIAV